MRRQEQREWLVKLCYQQMLNPRRPFSAPALLEEHGLPQTNEYLSVSLTSLDVHAQEIDALIAAHLKEWSMERLHLIDRAILRVAVNEMYFTDFAPPSVTMNESVALAKAYSDENAYRFINGVLSALFREKEEKAKREEDDASSESSQSESAEGEK